MTETTSQHTSVVKFPRFYAVTDASDHHYNGKIVRLTKSAETKILQEWKLLSKDLPDSIYVRVHENRVNLLRAAIVGARGTPYHDGLFFFDICFPSDYPAHPPLVYYRSFGVRINPNLYCTGYVCLSLLNTWSGNKKEKWNPKQSTILQVLLSIQALVLNEKPYFNEPGFVQAKGTQKAEKKSLTYNENAFILNCKTMLWLLSKPPKNFEPLVNQHFKDRGEFILNACQMYRRGLVKVGMFDGVENVKNGKRETILKSTESSLDKLFAQLSTAFEKNNKVFVAVKMERNMKMKVEAASEEERGMVVKEKVVAKEEKTSERRQKEKNKVATEKNGKKVVQKKNMVAKLWNILTTRYCGTVQSIKTV